MDIFFENAVAKSWDGFNLSELQVDEAYINITSTVYRLSAYVLSSDCHQCPFSLVRIVNPNSSETMSASTKHDSIWRFYNDTNEPFKSVSENTSLICEVKENFGEFGIYDVIIHKHKCETITRKEAVNIYYPLVINLLGWFLLLFLVKYGGRLWKTFSSKASSNSNAQNLETNLEPVAESEKSSTSIIKKKVRIQAIDTFRGLALSLMVFVNDGGGQYWFLTHSTWDGLYVADVLLPWFLWIMGLCIPLSQRSLEKNSVPKVRIAKQILRRTMLLFVLGLSLNTLGIGPVNLEHLRIPGILQRIAICYGTTTVVYLLFPRFLSKKYTVFNQIIALSPQWLVHIFIVGVHCYLTFYLPVPGCPTGYLAAGGIQQGVRYKNCTGGAAGYIDKLVLGTNRLWQNAPVRSVYQTLPFDPENILGCLTSIFQTFLGVQAGFVLVHYQKSIHRTGSFLIWSLGLSLCGLILCFNGIPINKNLWSLPFVLVTSGLAFLVFAALHQLVDNVGIWSGWPFIYPGANSILVYVGHEVCFQLFPWHWKISNMNTHLICMAENIWGAVMWIGITFVLYAKRVFITL